jgi:hypothetical protein
MNLALQGEKLPNAEQLDKYINIDFWEILKTSQFPTAKEALYNAGFNLNEEQLTDLKTADWVAEELITSSIRHRYGWGIPSEEAINNIIESIHTGLIEVGAGSGLWAGIIKSRTDKEVIACELNLRGDTPRPVFYPVENKCAKELIKQYPDHAVLIVWPDTNSMPFDIVKELQPNTKLFIAGPIEVTGNNDFYTYLDTHFELTSKVHTNKFSGQLDILHQLKKLPEPKLDNDGYFTTIKNQSLNNILKSKAKFKG